MGVRRQNRLCRQRSPPGRSKRPPGRSKRPPVLGTAHHGCSTTCSMHMAPVSRGTRRRRAISSSRSCRIRSSPQRKLGWVTMKSATGGGRQGGRTHDSAQQACRDDLREQPGVETVYAWPCRMSSTANSPEPQACAPPTTHPHHDAPWAGPRCCRRPGAPAAAAAGCRPQSLRAIPWCRWPTAGPPPPPPASHLDPTRLREEAGEGSRCAVEQARRGKKEGGEEGGRTAEPAAMLCSRQAQASPRPMKTAHTSKNIARHSAAPACALQQVAPVLQSKPLRQAGWGQGLASLLPQICCHWSVGSLRQPLIEAWSLPLLLQIMPCHAHLRGGQRERLGAGRPGAPPCRRLQHIFVCPVAQDEQAHDATSA